MWKFMKRINIIFYYRAAISEIPVSTNDWIIVRADGWAAIKSDTGLSLFKTKIGMAPGPHFNRQAFSISASLFGFDS
jgi:hypothetical protein